MRRGDEIEVSSDEEGLKGSWFKAILEDALPKSGNKKLNVTLLANDGSTTRKTTYKRFLRPIPPENLFTAAVEFEEGCVVEVSRSGGWWTGVVVKKINHENIVWVCFDSPPDLFQFQTGQVRQHFDWVRQEWVRPPVKVMSKKSTFSCGTMVEVNVMDTDVWVPSVVVQEMGDRKSFIVKSFKYISWNEGEEPKPNRTVGLSSIRLKPPAVSAERYGLMESVEVFLEPGWRPGMVTSVLSGDMYTVCLKATKESFEFKHEALRRSREPVLQNTSENGEKEVPEEHSREDDSRKRKRGEVEHNPGLSESAATESVSSLTTSPASTATALRQPESGTEEINAQLGSSEEVNNQKMKRVVLPFAKESSLWKELETMEVFQRAPQSPHFRPLVGESEVFREGHAIGMMLTLSKLLGSFKDLETDVAMSQLDSLKVSFAKLEKHGFSVSAPLARINKLLALKERQLKAIEEQKGFDRLVMALKEEMQHKILEMERQQVAVKRRYVRWSHVQEIVA